MKNIAALFALLPILTYAQPNATDITTKIASPELTGIKDSIESKINSGEVPSISVAVSKSGKVIWLQSFGWADKAMKVKAAISTPYAIASVSKTITSTAIMLLVEKGLIHLNEPIDKYLEESKLTYYKGNASQLTINHLLNMVGGIPHQWQYLYDNEKKPPITIEEQIKRYGIVVFPPCEVFQYSNFSPGIAELIIKNVSGMSLTEFMKKKVFTPLNMKNAAVNRNSSVARHMAKGYNYNGEMLVESEFYPKAGAGYYASISDLLKYGMFHLKNKRAEFVPILRDENIDKLHSPFSYTDRNQYYANGWGVLKIGKGMTSLLSNGAIDGSAASLLLLPDSDIAIACITNATVGSDFTDQLTFSIADALLPGYSNELTKYIEANAPAFEDKTFDAADSLIGRWKGSIITYKNTIPVEIIIDSTNKMTVNIQGQFETLLNNLKVNNGLILGQCYGHISLPETDGIPHYLELVLKPKKNEIYGSISAQSFHTNKPYFLLPAYLWLEKVF